jgi:DNA-binding IclR family transcriptional regulator
MIVRQQKAAVTGITASTREESSVRSVRRALAILRAFGPTDRALPLGEIARRAEVDKATALRLLRTMIRERLIEQQATRDYSLAPGVLTLSTGPTSADTLRRRAQPLLAAIGEVTGGAVFLAVLHHGKALYIESWAAERAVPTSVTIGLQLPLHVCAATRVLMAFLPLQDRMAMLAAPLPALSPATPTDPFQLSAILDTIRTRGWEAGYSELDDGISCLGLPLRDESGDVIATIGIAGRDAPLPPGGQPRHLDALLAKIREFERRYGRDVGRPMHARRRSDRVAEGRVSSF